MGIDIMGFLRDKIDLDKVKALVDSKLPGDKANALSAAADVDNALSAIGSIYQVAEDTLADGKDIGDIFTILGVASEKIFWLAKTIGGEGAGAKKKAFATAAITALYLYIDRGPDGDKNRINIPWVPEGIERWIEEKFLPIVVNFGIEGMYSLYRRYEEKNLDKIDPAAEPTAD